MAVVTVTGNAWDHTGAPIPAALRPELWFRPARNDQSGNALLAGVEAEATLNPTTGAFTVQLVAEPWLRYTPVLRWLINPSEPDPERWAYGYAEWSWTINPFPNGGPVGDLADVDLTVYSVFVSLNAPPPGFKGWWLYSPATGQTMPLDDPLIGELRMVN